MWYLIISLLINAASLWVAAYIVPGVNFGPNASILTILFVALIFGLINTIIKPILSFVTCPLRILTLGLFAFVVNALLLMLTAHLAAPAFMVDSFWSAFIASIIISIVSTILSALLIWNDDDDDE